MGALLRTWLLLDGPEVEGSRRINTTYNSDGGFLQSNILVKLFIAYHPHYGGEFGDLNAAVPEGKSWVFWC
jgi:hypothetical protein